MKYNQRILLRRLLPAIFWLLALDGSIAPAFIFHLNLPANYWWGFVPTAFVLLCLVVAKHIDRHEPYVHQIFRIATLLGIASYWLPTILFAILPFYIYATWKGTMNFRAFIAILISLAMDALYSAIFIYLGWIDNPWMHFFEPDYAWGWIPVGAIFIAWLASTIVRQLLRER